MEFKAFTQTHVYQRQTTPKEKDKSSIQCLESYDRNLYIGTKDATVQHLILPNSTDEDLSPVRTREGRARKLGSSGPIAQLRAVPVFNHLLVLWDRSITALNMFSLEPVPALQRIQHVSLFEVCNPSLTVQSGCVEMVTSSSRRKVVWIHVVGVDKWEAVKEIPLPQDPLALAVDAACLCVATCDRYLLCDIETGSSEELFPHSHNRQCVFVASVGRGEFLLNGPESLGKTCQMVMVHYHIYATHPSSQGTFVITRYNFSVFIPLGVFVMTTGICQRPPLQWPQEVLAAGVCFPYILALQPQKLSVYSALDQRLKQTVSLSGAKGLLSTPGK